MHHTLKWEKKKSSVFIFSVKWSKTNVQAEPNPPVTLSTVTETVAVPNLCLGKAEILYSSLYFTLNNLDALTGHWIIYQRGEKSCVILDTDE